MSVIISEIVPDRAIQTNPFDNIDWDKQTCLIKFVDKLNCGFTRNILNLAIQRQHKIWSLKRDLLSPSYATKVSDLIEIK